MNWRKTVPKAPFLCTMERASKRPPKVGPNPDQFFVGTGGCHGLGSFDGRAKAIPAFAFKHPTPFKFFAETLHTPEHPLSIHTPFVKLSKMERNCKE